MRKAKVVLAAVAVFGLTFGSAFGDDMYPPTWRDLDNSSKAVWEFSDATNPSPADVYVNNFVPPNPGPVFATVVPAPEEDWYATYEGRPGVWPLSGTATIELPNAVEARLYKYIWIQITWAPMLVDAEPAVSSIAPPGAAVQAISTTREGPWVTSVYIIRLEPNPEFETILIEGDIYVDEIVIDTICTDEEYYVGPIPAVSAWGLAVMVLLVLAAGTIVLRRQRALAA